MEAATWAPPMLAQALKKSELRTVTGEAWQYERKLDGLRCIAVRNGGEIELWSRNRLSFTPRFPGIVSALRQVPAGNFTVDGELVSFVDGRSSFAALQGHGGGATAVYCAFDLLHLLGRDTTALPLGDRRALLAQAMTGSGEAVKIVEPLSGLPADLLDRACSEGWEGLIAKRIAASYRPGRSSDWRKVKCSASQELVVIGWTEPSGSRSGFGALLVGYYGGDGRLCYAGKVGTGFDDRTLRDLAERLRAGEVAQAPLDEPVAEKGVHWVRPQLVAAVAFTEWTPDGRLRHPSFQGLRPDKDPAEVRREDSPS